MKFLNPSYTLRDDNIFNIREKEFEGLEPKIREILIPAEQLGFNIVDFGIKDSRFSSGELSKTIKQRVVIKLRKSNSDIDLSMDIPKLVDGNYIVINGRKKIPQFQLFDIPVVTRGKNIKLRTNVITIVVESKREEPYIDISFLGKKVPLSLMMFAYYGIDEVNKKFGLDQIKVRTDPITMQEMLIEDLIMFYEESSGYTQDDFIKEVGRTYSQYNSRSKGEDVVYALDLALATDPISKEFFKTDSVLDEVVNSIFNRHSYDDLDFANKRIRCFEYIVLSKISKAIFDLCMSNRTARQPKFNVNSSRILSECNVSDIIQFDFSINPIEELTKLSRTSLIGPGGFARENVPEHLRDISNSMYGRICPVDTPDRENCGILQNLVPNVRLDDNLRFKADERSDNPISVPVSMIPFCEHDDQTRLQMASSQMRQSILTKGFDAPMVHSGCEWLFSDKTQFLKTAKKDGEVVHVDDSWIMIKYDDNSTDIINIECRKISVGNMDFMKILVGEGDRVTKGDILAESMFMNDGKINFGRNLLVAINPYLGYNYEDGIVISDRLVEEDIFTSMHYIDLSFTIPPHKVLLNLNEDGEFKPLPDLNERVGIGIPYAKLKEISTGLDYYSVFNEISELSCHKQIIISDRKIYANSWNKEIPMYNDWVEKEIEKQKQEQRQLHAKLRSILDKKELAAFIRENNLNMATYVGKYKNKGELINGVHVELYGLFHRKISPGDKVANRHGNKGVISKIIPHEKMYQLKDGRHVDIIINPLGIISRINFGQVYESHMTMALDSVKRKLKEMLNEGKSKDDLVEYIMEFIKRIDRTETLWYSTNMEAFLNLDTTIIDEKFIDEFYVIQAPFESVNMQMMEEVMRFTETPFTQKVYDPIADMEVENPINVGFIYFYKMVHIAEARLAARGIGSYSKKTMQPLGGRRNKGGQRCGEMETSCFIGHNAIINLDECMTTKSDCVERKSEYLKQIIESQPVDLSEIENSKAETVRLLEAMLTTVGLDPETN